MKKLLSVMLCALMLLSCLATVVSADELLTTTSAPVGVWYEFEQTIMSEVEPSGDKYRFTSTNEPIYKGYDTAENPVGVDRRAANLTADHVKTDANGKLYSEGTGTWQGRDSDQSYFVYQYRMAQGATKMQWTATLGGQYGVYLWVGGDRPEADTSKWVKLATYDGDGKAGACVNLILEEDLTRFEGYETATHLYIKINDEDSSDGWGGRIAFGTNYPITLSYDVDAPAVEYDPNAPKDGKLHELYSFEVATEGEKAYLYGNPATYNNGIHFADKTASFTYLYNIEHYTKMTSVTWSAVVANQLYLQISEDGTTWVDVYKWEGELKEDGSGGLPAGQMAFDLTPYLTGTSSTLYVKISDSYPDAGWGGQIKNTVPVLLDVIYEELTEEEQAALDAAKEAEEAARLEAERAEEAARLEAEKAAAKEEAQAVIDQINALAAYTLEDLNEENYKDIFSEIRKARRAYNDLSDLALEAANEAGALTVLEAAEAIKAEYEAILDAKENEPADEPADQPTDEPATDDPATDVPVAEDPVDEPKSGISPIVIAAIAAVVVIAVIVIVIVSKKKK